MSKARVTISKLIGRNDSKMRLEIEDEISGITFVSVELTLENFAKAITGMAMVEGEMRVGELELVGKKREMKKETVSVENVNLKYEELVKLAAPFEIDGWQNLLHKGSRFDVTQNKKGEMSYTIPFVRWIDAPDES
jgi:hypothetical protein